MAATKTGIKASPCTEYRKVWSKAGHHRETPKLMRMVTTASGSQVVFRRLSQTEAASRAGFPHTARRQPKRIESTRVSEAT